MHDINAVPFGRALPCNLPGGRIFVSIPNGKDYRLNKTIPPDPAQYTHLISFTPLANKPGEMHRIMIVFIEIGSYLTKHNS